MDSGRLPGGCGLPRCMKKFVCLVLILGLWWSVLCVVSLSLLYWMAGKSVKMKNIKEKLIKKISMILLAAGLATQSLNVELIQACTNFVTTMNRKVLTNKTEKSACL